MAFNVGDFGKAFSFIGSFSFIPGAAAFAVVGAGLMAVDPTGGEDPSELVLNPFSGGNPHGKYGPFWGIPMLTGNRDAKLFGLGWAPAREGQTFRHYDSSPGFPGDLVPGLQREMARRRWRRHLMENHWILLPYIQDKNSPTVRYPVEERWKPGQPFLALYLRTNVGETNHFKLVRANFWGTEIDTRAHIVQLAEAIRRKMADWRSTSSATGWKRPRFQYTDGPSAELAESTGPAIWREIALHDYLGQQSGGGIANSYLVANGEHAFDALHSVAEWKARAAKEELDYLALEEEWEAWRAQVDQALALEQAKAEIIAAWEAAWASGQVPLPPPGLGGDPSPFGINPPPAYPIEHVSSVAAELGQKGQDPKVATVSTGLDVGSRVVLDTGAPAFGSREKLLLAGVALLALASLA